jgi:hypothetical protein
VHLVGGALGRLGDHLGLLLELWKFLFEGRKGRERGMSFFRFVCVSLPLFKQLQKQ